MLIYFLGVIFLLILIIKFVIWLVAIILSRFGRRFGCGVKWTTDQGEYIVVAGACGHIGAEYAREFASMGFNLILIGRDADKLQRLAESFQERQYPVFDIQILEADFSLPDFADIIREALDEVTPIVGLVNAIGVSYSAAKFTELGTQNVKDMIMINVLAPTMLIDIVLPKMSQNQRGVIINLSSQVAKYKLPYYTVFGASKAFMHVLSESLSFEYANNGVIVQNVSPLFINSTMASEIRPNPLRVSSALAVFSAMQTVGIESTTYGYWSHRVVALILDCGRFFLGSRLLTSVILYFMPRYISFRTASTGSKYNDSVKSGSADRKRSKDSTDNFSPDNLGDLIKKRKNKRSKARSKRKSKSDSARESKKDSKTSSRESTKPESKLSSNLDSNFDSRLDSKYDPMADQAKLDSSKYDSKVHSNRDPKSRSKSRSKARSKEHSKRRHDKHGSKRHSRSVTAANHSKRRSDRSSSNKRSKRSVSSKSRRKGKKNNNDAAAAEGSQRQKPDNKQENTRCVNLDKMEEKGAGSEATKSKADPSTMESSSAAIEHIQVAVPAPAKATTIKEVYKKF